jgi:hypothetical protein
MRDRAASSTQHRAEAQRSHAAGLAAAEERVWLETYLADLMNNQRVFVYTYTSLERLVGQLENLLHDQPKKAVALTAQLM